LRDDTGNGAYDCSVDVDGEPVANATIKVHLPADFSAFLLEHLS
jgi:predicted hotdog family 3-hydroxylacyl-ACP dehydratase